MRWNKVICSLLIAALAGCSSGGGNGPVLQGGTTMQQMPVATHDVTLRVGDPVEIRIGGVSAEDIAMINNVYNVDGNGFINLPHIGSIRAAGLSTAQLSQSIQGAYVSSGIYTNPTISIAQQAASRFVTVGGEVKAPQRVPYTNDLTLLAAIQAAGGFTEFANRKRVVWISGSSRTIVDATAILRTGGQDVGLSPGDQIQVPSSAF